MKSILTSLVTALCVLSVATAQAGLIEMGEHVRIDADGRKHVVAMGGDVDVTGRIINSVKVMGGSVNVDASVGGDVWAMGGDVFIGGAVQESVAAFSATVVIEAEIGDDLRAAGADVEIREEATVRGDADLAGAYVEIAGVVDRDALIAAEEVSVMGEVGGDVYVTAERLEIGPNAVIGGHLRHRGPNQAVIDDSASILGGYEFEQVDWDEYDGHWRGWRGPDIDHDGIFGHAIGAIVLAVIAFFGGLVLSLLFPGLFGRAIRTGRNKPITSFFIGLAAAVLIPAFAIGLIVTILGAVIGLALFAIYGVLAVMAWIATAFLVGHLLFDRSSGPVEPNILLLLVGVAVLAILSLIPIAGGFLIGILSILGFGAMTSALFGALRNGR